MKRLNMKFLGIGLLLTMGLLSLAPSARADAIPNPLITIDENGHGTLVTAGGALFVLPFALSADPGPGGLASVLTYDMLGPPALIAGDVLLQEGPGGPILDVIRFNPAGTGSAGYHASILFYSDNLDGFDALADTASPPGALYPNTVTILEVGPEGDNGAFYTPNADQPGYVPGFQVQYHFISDAAVPEPASVVLIGFGVAGLGLIRRKRA